MYQNFLKRIIDFTIALVGLAIIFPILVLTIILIKIDSNGKVFFTQERAGISGRPFYVYKFRTMTDKPREVTKEIHKGDPDVTKVGKWLRRLKIDELPQLLNVLNGDMSLVGPRPGLIRQIPDLDENGRYRILVRPGLTGLAQINGNIHLSWPQRWVYDRNYVQNLSLWLDVKILFKTILIVILGEDKFIKKPNV